MTVAHAHKPSTPTAGVILSLLIILSLMVVILSGNADEHAPRPVHPVVSSTSTTRHVVPTTSTNSAPPTTARPAIVVVPPTTTTNAPPAFVAPPTTTTTVIELPPTAPTATIAHPHQVAALKALHALAVVFDYHYWPDWNLWHAVGLCEQRGYGQYDTNGDGIAWHGSPLGGLPGSDYGGGLGLSRDFWNMFRGDAGVTAGDGALASPAEQIRVARVGSQNGTHMLGWSSWRSGCVQRQMASGA